MNFPHNGKSLSEFSTQWKNIFHGVDGGGAAAPTHAEHHARPEAKRKDVA